MPNCAVVSCKNTNQNSGKEIKFFRFPKNELAKEWIEACHRKDQINLKYACICSDHFESSCFETPLKHKLLQYTPKNFRNLKTDSVPTLKLPAVLPKPPNMSSSPSPSQSTDVLLSITKESDHNEPEIIYIEGVLMDHSGPQEGIPDKYDPSVSPHLDHKIPGTNCWTLETEVKKLKRKIKLLEKQNNDLLLKLKDKNAIIKERDETIVKYKNVLGTIFKPVRIKKIS